MTLKIDLTMEQLYGMAWMRTEYQMSWNDIAREYGYSTQFVIRTAIRRGWFVPGAVLRGRGIWDRAEDTRKHQYLGDGSVRNINTPYSDAERADQRKIARDTSRVGQSNC